MNVALETMLSKFNIFCMFLSQRGNIRELPATLGQSSLRTASRSFNHANISPALPPPANLSALSVRPYKPAHRAWDWSQPAGRAGLTAQPPHLPRSCSWADVPPGPPEPCRGLCCHRLRWEGRASPSSAASGITSAQCQDVGWGGYNHAASYTPSTEQRRHMQPNVFSSCACLFPRATLYQQHSAAPTCEGTSDLQRFLPRLLPADISVNLLPSPPVSFWHSAFRGCRMQSQARGYSSCKVAKNNTQFSTADSCLLSGTNLGWFHHFSNLQ